MSVQVFLTNCVFLAVICSEETKKLPQAKTKNIHKYKRSQFVYTI